MVMSKDKTVNIVGVAGLVLITAGVAQISLAASQIVLGVILTGLAITGALR